MGAVAKMGVIAQSWRRMEKGLNDAVSGSFVGRYFKVEARGSCFTRELRAGTATFLTMAYIITVNATIISDSGGACVGGGGAYDDCVAATKSDLVVATILSAMFGSLAMGLLANLPFGLAPAMGPNAYLAYNMVGLRGSGPIKYKTGLAVVLVEGCVFLALSASGLRARLVRLIPRSVRLACAVGIGLFIAFVGLQAQQGVGLVGPDASTLVTAAACARTDPDTGACLGGRMRDPKFWLAASGFVITTYGLMKEVKGSMTFGILFVTLVSWVRGTSVTIFPDTPRGDASYQYFRKVADFHKIESTIGAISFTGFNEGPVWVALATLLYVDVLGTTGTLYTLAELGGFVDESGGFEGEYVAYIVDAGSTVVGSALGVATTATYVESSAGMREGGRTGLTAVVVGLYFMTSLFFTPLLTNVPPWAIGPSLVMVGVMMMGVVKDIDWSNVREAVPAFVTILLMPLTYSIANGIIAGIGLYVVLGAYDYVAGLVRRVNSLRKVVVSEQNQVSTVEII